MSVKSVASSALHGLRMGMASLALFQFIVGTSLNGATPPNPYPGDATTRTPIKHVIVIIGENRTFDHVFATYKPVTGQTVSNLLSNKIVNADGTPGTNFAAALQNTAVTTATFSQSPGTKAAYTVLPPVLTGSAPTMAPVA